MKTTVKHVGSIREWEGLIENWEAHVHEIKHWCDGGDVERISGARSMEYLWMPHEEYRIKQREPKPGEVWTHKNRPYEPWVASDKGWSRLTDGVYDLLHSCHFLAYSAPSVESYYAREFLKRRNGGPLTCTVLQDAAQLDH